MTNKKQRMSMLDNLAGAAASTPPLQANRALRAARDAVDSHRVWELDPAQIDLGARISDRLDDADIVDLRDAIETNGQAVPILVRRDPAHPDRYLLVYGLRRLLAVQSSEKVSKVKALVAQMEADEAIRAQISENMARRDLSFIEKALFARELIDQGFGTQAQVAEVLTVTKSSVSMALTILEQVGVDLVRAIGPAHGVGRPRWEALGRSIDERGADRAKLIDVAMAARATAETAAAFGDSAPDAPEPSLAAFEAVMSALPRPKATTPARRVTAPSYRVPLPDTGMAHVSRTRKSLRIDLPTGDFADWMEAEGQDLLAELHQRFQQSRS